MNDIKKIERIEVSSLKEKVFIGIASFMGSLGIFNALYAGNGVYMTGYIGMSFILFSASGFLAGFIRSRFLSAEIQKNGVMFTAKNNFTFFLSSHDILRVGVRNARRMYAVSFYKDDGGYADIKSFLTKKNAEKFVRSLVWSPDRNASLIPETGFSNDVFTQSEDGAFVFSWKDLHTGFYGFSLALLFSGIIFMSGGIFAGNMDSGIVSLLLAAMTPWIIYLHYIFRKRSEMPAVLLGKNRFAFGKVFRGKFVPVKELERKKMKSFRYSYDLTTAVQSLFALYDEGLIRISLPGLSAADGLSLNKKLNEILKQEL